MSTPSTGISLSQILAAYANNLLNDPALLDPVSKLRVSEPQALIDTDFEYGTQPLKWETISVINNVPTSYARPGNIGLLPLISVTSTQGSNEVLVFAPSHGLIVGSSVYVTGLSNSLFEGPQVVRRVLSGDFFTYNGQFSATTSETLSTPYTTLSQGALYTNAKIPIDYVYTSGSNIIIQTQSNTYIANNTSIGLYGMTYRQTKTMNLSSANVFINSNSIVVQNVISNTSAGEVTFSYGQSNNYLATSIVPYNWFSLSNIQYIPNTAINITSNIITFPVPHGLNETNNYAVFIQIPLTATLPVTNTITGLALGSFETVNYANVFYANILSTTQIQLRGNNLSNTQRFLTNSSVTFSSSGSNLVNQPFIVMSNLVEIQSISVTGPPTANLVRTFTNLPNPVDNAPIVFCSIGNSQQALNGLTIVTNNFVTPTLYYMRNPTNNTFFVSSSINGPPLTNISRGTASNAFVIQLANFPEQNSIYWPNHGMTTSNNRVFYSNASTGPVIGGLTANLHYNVNVINRDRFQLIQPATGGVQFQTTSNVVDLINSGGGSHTFSYLRQSNLYSIFMPNHGLQQNDVIRYFGNPSLGLSNSTAYYAKIVDRDNFKLGVNTWSDFRVTSVAKPAYANIYALTYQSTSQAREETGRVPFIGGDTVYVYGSTEYPGLNGVYLNTNLGLIFNQTNLGVSSIINTNVTALAATSNLNIPITASNLIQLHSIVTFSPQTSSQMGGIFSNAIYYVNGVTPTSFTVSLTPGGTSLNVTNTSTLPNNFVSIMNFDYSTSNTIYVQPITTATANVSLLVDNTNSIFTTLSNTFVTRIQPITNFDNNSIQEITQYQKINSTFKSNSTIGNQIIISTSNVYQTQNIRFDWATMVANSNITLPMHGLYDGAPITYISPSDGSLPGLSNGSIYYAIVIDRNTIRLANTYQSAISRSNLVIASNSTASGSHFFTTNVISGGFLGTGTLTSYSIANTTSLTNNTVTRGTNSKFYGCLTTGDSIIIENISKSNIAFLGGDNFLTLESDIPAVNNVNYIIPSFIAFDPDAYVFHRVYDGGVQLVGGLEPFQSLIRQTHTQFRYQSGKGLQMSSGTNFNPPNDISSLTLSNNIITVNCVRPHGFVNNIFSNVKIITANVSSGNNYYNGNAFNIFSVNDALTFTYKYASNVFTGSLVSGSQYVGDSTTNTRIQNNWFNQNDNVLSSTNVSFITGVNKTANTITLSSAIGSPPFEVYPFMSSNTSTGFPKYIVNNTGNVYVRVGMFDAQNGLFFEYSNNTLYCCRRNSTTQIGGRVNIVKNSSTVIGIGTSFTKQVNIGDFIVIRGISYKVTFIQSDTLLSISPPYKGVTSNNVIVSETIDTKIPQNQWSISTMPNLDINRMHMIFIDFSWYGAGKVRFGFRDSTGKIFYCHEFIHNNRETEAYMRSGNLPARYEIGNNGTIFYNPTINHWGTSVIMDGKFDDDKSYVFTGESDVLCFTNGNRQTFTSAFPRGSTRLSNIAGTFINILKPGTLLRPTGNEAGTQTLTQFFAPYTAINSVTLDSSLVTNLIVTLNKPTIAASNTLHAANTLPNSPLFATTNLSTVTLFPQLSVLSYAPIPLLSIRLAPSVDSGTTGQFGGRDLINRMQLVPESLSVSVTHESVVTLYINADLSQVNWTPMYTPSLAQTYRHQFGDVVQNGVILVTYRVSGGGIGTASSNTARNIETTRFDLKNVAILSNSIFGGNETFPNGPDVLTVAVTPIDTTNIQANAPYIASCALRWTESQA